MWDHKDKSMKIKTGIIVVLCTCELLVSCFDLYSKRYKIDGPYFVETDPGANYQTLYYDLGDGTAIGRVKDVKRVGHIGKFIIAETKEGYYFIERQKDNKFLNGNEIIGSPRTHDYFLKWLDSLKIKKFKFDYYLKK